MSTLSAQEQELYDTARAALPRWLYQDGQPEELTGAFAKLFARAETHLRYWLDQTFIRRAVGFWLDQHAADRNLRRQLNETDATLAARIRSYAETVTLQSIQDAINAVLAAAGLPDGAIVELRKSQAFLSTLDATVNCIPASRLVDGETFIINELATPHTFEFDTDGLVGPGHIRVDIAAAVTDADVAAAIITAASGAGFTNLAAALHPISDNIVKFRHVAAFPMRAVGVGAETVADPDFSTVPGRHGAYVGSYRVGAPFAELIVILPYGTDAATLAAVTQAVTVTKAGGVTVQIEVRGVP